MEEDLKLLLAHCSALLAVYYGGGNGGEIVHKIEKSVLELSEKYATPKKDT